MSILLIMPHGGDNPLKSIILSANEDEHYRFVASKDGRPCIVKRRHSCDDSISCLSLEDLDEEESATTISLSLEQAQAPNPQQAPNNQQGHTRQRQRQRGVQRCVSAPVQKVVCTPTRTGKSKRAPAAGPRTPTKTTTTSDTSLVVHLGYYV